MENHPIPQDVTGFQFKLIGQMTVKQFAYLCAGIIFGWIFFSSHLFIAFRLLLSLFFFASGFLLAFVPLEGRPMDTMIANFLKALFSPNQYVYDKNGGLSFDNFTSKHQTVNQATSVTSLQKDPVVVQSQAQPQTTIEFKMEPALQPVQPLPQQSQIEQLIVRIPSDGQGEEKLKDELEKEKEELKKEMEEVEKLKTEQKGSVITPSAMHDKLVELEKRLEETMAHKQKLEDELVELSKKLQNQTAPAPKVKIQPVKQVSKDLGKTTGFAFLPDAPNVIIGILKDPRGNVLPNILVEVQDAENNPVRAFKTNQLGQFASATALRNGTYTITFEDPTGKNSFDKVEITAGGEILDPIEVISHDQREELRKALFQTAN